MVAWSARRRTTLALGIAVAAGAVALLGPAAYANAMQEMPLSTIRQQVAYVLAHRRPGDVVVVGAAASYPFAYYWPERPRFVPPPSGPPSCSRWSTPGGPTWCWYAACGSRT